MFSARGSTKVFIPVFLGVIAVLIFFLSRGDQFIPKPQRAEQLYPGQSATTDAGRGVTLSSRASSSSMGYAIGGEVASESGSRGIYIGEAGAPSSARISVFTVTYGDSGFDSLDMTLPIGVRTIRIINQSRSLLWPLGTGEWVPMLDAGYGLSPGSTYTYQFPEAAGSFGVQNRLRPEHRTVIRTQ